MWSQICSRESPEAIFSVSVYAKEPSLELRLVVETRDLGDNTWTQVGSSASCQVGFHRICLNKLRQEIRFGVEGSGYGTASLDIHKPHWLKTGTTGEEPAPPEETRPPPEKAPPSEEFPKEGT